MLGQAWEAGLMLTALKEHADGDGRCPSWLACVFSSVPRAG
jgi:hypothetical protein